MTHENPVPELIARLGLVRHPEGGWYRECYRCQETVPGDALPDRFGGARSFCTSIYFLLEHGDISALHRIKSDELWHFYAGSPLTVHAITPEGDHRQWLLGAAAGAAFQAAVPAGCWFGAEIPAGAFALVGCTVSPGFDFADFELAERGRLEAEYPQHHALIRRLTRG
jgi:predicted cupin superfamily sugar epimerase